MDNMVFGYARVSTREQNLDRQVIRLRDHGIAERNIIVDKESGKNLERPGYQALTTTMLRRGDTLVVTSLDRLGRSKADIQREMQRLKQEEAQTWDSHECHCRQIGRIGFIVFRLVKDTSNCGS